MFGLAMWLCRGGGFLQGMVGRGGFHLVITGKILRISQN